MISAPSQLQASLAWATIAIVLLQCSARSNLGFEYSDIVQNFIDKLPIHDKREAAVTQRQLTGTTQDSPVRPLIYIYDLPEEYHNFTEFGDVSDSFYGLDQLFPQLLRESPYWTNNTNEADFFFVDVWMYWPTRDPHKVVKELQKIGPWWDKRQGADHIFVITSDFGRCGYEAPILGKAIFLHHFGRLIASESMPMVHGKCDLFSIWGAECDREMVAAEAAIFKRTIDTCHKPRQDIVVPPTCYEPHPDKKFTHEFKSMYYNDELKGRNRTALLFYSGKIDLDADKPNAKTEPWSDAGYSFGARQMVYRMFHNVTGFAVLNHHTHSTYWEHLTDSIFCLAAAGWGWGGRFKVSATRGCIPVIVQDGVLVEFEEQLPLKDYAIRVPMWMVHKLPDILHVFIKTGRAAKMQKALECAWRLHWWRRPQGRAFEVVICELKRRLLGKDKITLNTETCTLECGDGKPVQLLDGPNTV